MAGLVVIGYDGSADARDAVAFAAAVLRAEAAVVVNVWQPALATAPTTPLGAPLPPAFEELPERERAARRIAEDGAALARDAGLAAEPDIRGGGGAHDIATALHEVAAERCADLLVVGRRGMSRLEAVVLGSVADAAVRDGRYPVLVVPRAAA